MALEYPPKPKLDKNLLLLSPMVVQSVSNVKVNILHRSYTRLRCEEILLILSIQAQTNPLADLILKQIPKLKGLEAHSSHILSEVDKDTFRRLGINITEEPMNYKHRLYYK